MRYLAIPTFSPTTGASVGLMSVFDPLQTFETWFSNARMKLPIVATGLALVLLSQSAAFAKRPVKLEGMEYSKARRIILSYGWKPRTGHCVADRDTCANYPEVEACSASSPINCGMVFVRHGSCLMMGTEGETPPSDWGQLPVVAVHFRHKSCSELLRNPKS